MREKFDDDILDDDTDDAGDETSTDAAPSLPPTLTPPSRAWRSIEQLREMRELRKHLDDFTYDEDGPNIKDLGL